MITVFIIHYGTCHSNKMSSNYIIRVSTKWLIFLRTFALYLCMKRNEFWAIFLRNLCKTGNIFCESCAIFFEQNHNFLAQFAQNRKFYAKCNFLGKLSKIDILSLELNNWRILTYEYDNYYTTLNWLLPVTKSLNLRVWNLAIF